VAWSRFGTVGGRRVTTGAAKAATIPSSFEGFLYAVVARQAPAGGELSLSTSQHSRRAGSALTGPKAVSLFSGAGGLDLGVEAAGYSVVYAVESDPVAVATLNRNRERYFPELAEVRPQDITVKDPAELMAEVGVERGDLDLLVGGPPCVAFSKSGFHLEYKRLGRDPRASLLDDYLKYLDALRPAAYILENVFGLAYRNQSAEFYGRLRSGIEALGYSFCPAILNAADFGVPQNRQRLFVIGSRDGRSLSHPEATHWGEHERRKAPPNVDTLRPHATAGDALAASVTEPMPGDEVNGLYGHLLPEIPPGGNYLHFTEHAGHPEPLFGWRTRYWTFLLKLDPGRPSPTLQGQPGPYVGPFHWENRRLRPAELKRLHTFPPDYEFTGNRKDIHLQVGNAVCPDLAKVIATSVLEQTARQLVTA
jgi:DNA (cytosine-5)-methyltransferase 1